MPKNNPKQQIPRTPRLPEPGQPGGGGGECPPETPETLLFELANLDTAALKGLRSGEPMSIRPNDTFWTAHTAIGTRIGDIVGEDAELLRGRRIRRARVYAAQVMPPRCIAEVIL